MYQVIRASDDYQVVVVITPPDVGFDDEGVKFFACNPNIQGFGATEFLEISKEEAIGYFTGHADGLGFGDAPDKPFEFLEEVKKWMIEARRNWARGWEIFWENVLKTE